MKKISAQILSVLASMALVFLVLAGCESREDSATMQEARSLNAETTEVGRKFHERLNMIREDLQAQLDGNPEGLAVSFESALIQINQLDERYHAWMSNQVLLPGQTCNHDHANGEHHHHHESMDELSDTDHLALQKAIRAELEGLVAELNTLKP